MTTPLQVIEQGITSCRRCPELIDYCAQVATTKRKAYAGWDYWGGPVPGFGDSRASLVIVGLAPGAHGANRTGRVFTGDRSGDFLYSALHRAGLSNQAHSIDCADGLHLKGVYVTAALRCAPPGNRPSTDQLARCRPHLVDELRLLRPRVLLCLGSIGWRAGLAALQDLGQELPRPRPRFAHGAERQIAQVTLLGSYHVSQQNTFTGRLTEAMFDAVLARACEVAGNN